ncbi:MAG: hypothetical protein AAFP90_12945 [Planctomycetota bacterium]
MFALLLVLPFAQHCNAQSGGTTVQLPAVRSFSYSGTVVVPDGGTISLGGSGGARMGSSRSGLGPFVGRSSGTQMRSGNAIASATVIDLQHIDQQIRGTGAADPDLFLRSRPGTRGANGYRSAVPPDESFSKGWGRLMSAMQQRDQLADQRSRARRTHLSSPASAARSKHSAASRGTGIVFSPTNRTPTQANAPASLRPEDVQQGKAFVRHARELRRKGNETGATFYYEKAIPLLPPDLQAYAVRELFGVSTTP